MGKTVFSIKEKLFPKITSSEGNNTSVREEALEYRGTDDHTAVFTKIDTKNKVMTPYIKDEADLTKVPVTFTFNGKVEIKVQDKTISNGTELDLSKDLKITLISNEKED